MQRVWLNSYPPEVPAEVDLASLRTLPQLIDEACARHGDAIAYVQMGRTLTYKQLDDGSRAFAADLVAEAVPRLIGTAMIIGLGGDVAVGQHAEYPQQWRVTLSESASETELPEQVLLEVGGLSTVALPTTGRGESGVPHLMDPRTGLPVEVIWRSVTVSAASCLDAHAAAAAALVMGDLAPAWLWEHDLAARLIATDSHTLRVAGWPDH